MKTNIGHTERVARIVAGLALLKLGKKHDCKIGLLGLVPLVSGVTGHCHVYDMLGINTAEGCSSGCAKTKKMHDHNSDDKIEKDKADKKDEQDDKKAEKKAEEKKADDKKVEDKKTDEAKLD